MKIRWVVRCTNTSANARPRHFWVHDILTEGGWRSPPGTPNAVPYADAALVYETKAEAEAVAVRVAPAYDWLIGHAHPRRLR